MVPIHVCAWIVPPPAAIVTTPLENVGHVPLGMGKCVGLVPLPPSLEPPEEEPEASAPPLEPELEPELELLDPLDDPEPPEPLDELLPPELVLPEPPPLLDPPLLLLELLELPHAVINPASTKPIDATTVFIVRPAN